jgi:hypothetical protein
MMTFFKAVPYMNCKRPSTAGSEAGVHGAFVRAKSPAGDAAPTPVQGAEGCGGLLRPQQSSGFPKEVVKETTRLPQPPNLSHATPRCDLKQHVLA